MFDYKSLFVNDQISVIGAIQLLDKTSRRILVVVDVEERILGVVNDGDIRRWILKNGDLKAPVSEIMNRNPLVVEKGEEFHAIEIMRERFVSAVPVIGEAQRVVNIVFWNAVDDGVLSEYDKLDIPVVIMAGGKGTRLYPYTKVLPKPLVPIGDIPIVQRIINRFNRYGATEFIMTVNYKKNMIKSSFEDVEKDYKLSYFEEEKPLGTGGGLAYLKGDLSGTFILSNCDILIEADFAGIYDFHKENNHKITIITSLKQFKIPYGVIRISSEGNVEETVEKPIHNYLINTGVYFIEAELLDMIPKGEYYHITQLIDECLEQGISVGTYPVSESSWLDMGQMDEMQRMIEFLGDDHA